MDVYVGKEFTHLSFWLNIWFITLLISNHILALSSIVLSGSNLKPVTISTAVSTVISIVIAWIFAPSYGVGAVVISYLIYIAMMISFYYIYYIPRVLKYNSLKIFGHSFLKPVSVGLISYAVSDIFMTLFQVNTYIYMLISLLIFSVIYSVLSLMFTIKFDEIIRLGREIIK